MRVTRQRWFVKYTHCVLTLCLLSCSGSEAGSPHRIRILAYNIHHGAGLDGVLDLPRIADVINRTAPDIVALQEVDSAAVRTDGVDQAAALAELTGMQPAFGHFMDYQGGRYGMAVLSSLPILGSVSHRLPDGEEPRTAVAIRIQLPHTDEQLVVVGIHLYRSEEERLAQARRLVEIYERETAPVILAGDFNSTPGSAVMNLVAQQWTVPNKGDVSATFPADGPEREIDYIVYRPRDRFKVVESLVIAESVASDHRPVLLEIEY